MKELELIIPDSVQYYVFSTFLKFTTMICGGYSCYNGYGAYYDSTGCYVAEGHKRYIFTASNYNLELVRDEFIDIMKETDEESLYIKLGNEVEIVINKRGA